MISLHALGFKRPQRPRRRGGDASAAYDHNLALARAFYCGARYSRNNWRRRAPPRMITGRSGAPEYWRYLEQQISFYAGYDAWTRARWAHEARWTEEKAA